MKAYSAVARVEQWCYQNRIQPRTSDHCIEGTLQLIHQTTVSHTIPIATCRIRDPRRIRGCKMSSAAFLFIITEKAADRKMLASRAASTTCIPRITKIYTPSSKTPSRKPLPTGTRLYDVILCWEIYIAFDNHHHHHHRRPGPTVLESIQTCPRCLNHLFQLLLVIRMP